MASFSVMRGDVFLAGMKEEEGPVPSLPLRLATVSQGPDRTQHLSGHRMYLTQAPILVTPGRKGSHIFSVLQIFFFLD